MRGYVLSFNFGKRKVNMPDINSLDIEATIVLNMEDCASFIELSCADALLEPPKGIYSKSSIDPVMVSSGNYYTITNGATGVVRTPINEIGDVKKGMSVYTEACGVDKMVISNLQLQDRDRHLSALPMRPYRGIKIVEQLITNQIDNFVKYRSGSRDLYRNIRVHLKKEVSDEQFQEIVREIKEQYSETKSAVREFMGKHDWHLYFVKIKGSTVTIQKSIDYRVYDWMCRMESKEWA